eukprot:TRINITY_DN4650_c0_g1_i1.p1 TRINITY_DN4650_c0_g1~~TRINITY_DN4650_c0_g1_i1.p1  ORF type:complete len:846 (+),score=185.66 TRINITY_DN4650_c0_g1_i1:377-2914(+)
MLRSCLRKKDTFVSVPEPGVMEISFLKALLNSISQFGLLSSFANVKSEPVKKYHQNIDEALKLLMPLLDEVIDSAIASDEQLNNLCKELDAAVNDTRELVEGWHQMMSKVYFVLQIESLITKIETSGLQFCRFVNALLEDHVDPSRSECLQHCVQKFQQLSSDQISDIIKDAMRDLQEKTAPSPQSLVKIEDSLNLTSNQELLLEAVALEKVKTEADHDKNIGESDYIGCMIALVTHMHDCLMEVEQCQTINGVNIPADFCCPLSLKLMSDPVIVASGQTYEKVFIKDWLDMGLMVCPKTRQTLSHVNLIPNYTVKALIANWCESNSIKLPDPLKLASLSSTSTLFAHEDISAGDGIHYPRSPESSRPVGSQRSSVSSNGTHPNDRPVSPHLNSFVEGAEVSARNLGSRLDGVNGIETDTAKISLVSSEERNVGNDGQTSTPLRWEMSETSAVSEQFQGHDRSASISSAVSSNDDLQGTGDANESSRVSRDLTHYGSDTSGELMSDAPPSSTPHRELQFSSHMSETRPRNQTIWRRPSERVVPRIMSSLDTRADLSGLETQVRNLIEDLQSTSVDVQRAAAHELRILAKHNMDNRIVIANCGAVSHLVTLLHSTDSATQENAVTALLNLSINDNNKMAIANAGAIDPLIHVLETGNPEAKENAAATLFSLSVMEENKVRIGRSRAIGPLVELLGNGSPRGKKDAATALFNLSIFHENKARIVQAGAVRYLVELMDPAAGMVDKAVAVLANLATIPEGRNAIGQEGGIPVLVEVVELGSSRGKENAAAALLHLCTNSSRFCNMVLQEGAVPPLVALSQSGTARAKEKAQLLLTYFRNQRHNNAARS